MLWALSGRSSDQALIELPCGASQGGHRQCADHQGHLRRHVAKVDVVQDRNIQVTKSEPRASSRLKLPLLGAVVRPMRTALARSSQTARRSSYVTLIRIANN